MKKRKNIFKESVTFLIIALLSISSTVVIANTTNENIEAQFGITDIDNLGINEKISNENSCYKANTEELWNNGLPDGRSGVESCIWWDGYQYWNMYVVDDFDVPSGGWRLERAYFRIINDLSTDPSQIPVAGVKLFDDTGNYPEDNPFYEHYAVQYYNQFNAYYTGNYYFGRPEIEIEIDLSPIDLTPGKYWICCQILGLNEESFWLTTQGSGNDIHCDYTQLGFPRWTQGWEIFGYYYDVSFRLLGEILAESSLCCSDDIKQDNIKFGATVTDGFIVENCGESGSELHWEITDWPTWGNWTFNPTNGSLSEGENTNVSVTIQIPDQTNTPFTGEVKIINGDNSSDTCSIPVSIKTPRNKPYNYNILSRLFERFPNLFPILRYLLLFK